MNSFPESGFPVLADCMDNVCLNTLYGQPLRPNGFRLDIVGATRFVGAMTITGALTVSTTVISSSYLSPQIASTGATDVLGLYILANTAATAAAPVQNSPHILFRSRAWNGAADTLVDFYEQVYPQQGTTPSGELRWACLMPGGVKTTLMSLFSNGNLVLPGTGKFKALEVINPETKQYEDVLIQSDLAQAVPYAGALKNIDLGAKDLTTTGAVKAVHKCADGTAAVADGTYTMGLKLTGGGVDGTITIKDGLITAVQQAT